jgi:hypothetical protein
LNNYDTDSLQATQLCFLRGQSGAGTDFLWVLQFPLLMLIPLTAPHSLIILSSLLPASLNNHYKKINLGIKK